MNDEQRKQIKILRYQGIGYKKIAESMGFSRDVIRGYCKRKFEKDNPKIYKLRCDYCRKEYLSERVQKRKFCSND